MKSGSPYLSVQHIAVAHVQVWRALFG